MRRLAAGLIDKLDLETALQEELNSWRNQIPPEPWVAAVRAEMPAALAWIKARLAAGADGLPSVVINARKATVGTRPVPILGIADRVAYRALSKFVLKDLGLPDRSPAAYREFLHGPIEFAFRDQPGPAWNVFSFDVKYVVEADMYRTSPLDRWYPDATTMANTS